MELPRSILTLLQGVAKYIGINDYYHGKVESPLLQDAINNLQDQLAFEKKELISIEVESLQEREYRDDCIATIDSLVIMLNNSINGINVDVGVPAVCYDVLDKVLLLAFFVESDISIISQLKELSGKIDPDTSESVQFILGDYLSTDSLFAVIKNEPINKNANDDTPEEYIDKLKKTKEYFELNFSSIKNSQSRKKQMNSYLAKCVKEKFPEISNAELGRLLPATKGAIVNHTTAVSQGRRLLGKK